MSATPSRHTARGGSSIRARLQGAFVALALAAVGLTGLVALFGSSRALQVATYDRLTAIRETRRHALERYFEDLVNHVVALSTSESTTLALEDLGQAWATLTPMPDDSAQQASLERYYQRWFARSGREPDDAPRSWQGWVPQDRRARWLQYQTIVASPHPDGAKDLAVELPGTGRFGAVHARHHPTFHRYLSAFGFYDIFLVSVPEGRVVYTVLKELDLGADLTTAPYRSTKLGRAYERAVALGTTGPEAVIEDYAPYAASGFAPAAFVAAPIRVAGATVGVLAIQISIREVDRVMTGAQSWQAEGLGHTGQAYVVGDDNTLRSDLRGYLEDTRGFPAELAAAGIAPDTIETIRRNATTVLTLPVDLHVVSRVQAGEQGTELGVNLLGTRVLRSHAPLAIPDLRWAVVAEIDAAEALAPVRALQARVVIIGLGLAAIFLALGGWMGASLTRPLVELSRSVSALGSGALGTTVDVRSSDEIGQLAASFNQMSEALARTTVSKAELEVLAGRLITAQEDERRRIARELHDDLVQRLAAVAIEIGQLERLPAASVERHEGLARLRVTVGRLSEEVHGLSRRLHPAVLDELGLVAAIEAECRAFLDRGGPPVDLTIAGSMESLDPDRRLAVFRIVQEALRNISQHARASEVTVALRQQPEAVVIDIVDDGVGFDREAAGWAPGLGLASMEERARLLGGSLTVTSSPRHGTRVHGSLPIEVVR